MNFLYILSCIGIGAGYSVFKIVEYSFYAISATTYFLLNIHLLNLDYNLSKRKTELLFQYYNSTFGWKQINELAKIDPKYTSSFLRNRYSKSKNDVDFVKRCTGREDTYEDFSIDAVDY